MEIKKDFKLWKYSQGNVGKKRDRHVKKQRIVKKELEVHGMQLNSMKKEPRSHQNKMISMLSFSFTNMQLMRFLKRDDRGQASTAIND